MDLRLCEGREGVPLQSSRVPDKKVILMKILSFAFSLALIVWEYWRFTEFWERPLLSELISQ